MDSGSNKEPGVLRAAAKSAGAVTEKGTIAKDWLQEQARKAGTIGRRARLALTLAKLTKKEMIHAE